MTRVTAAILLLLVMIATLALDITSQGSLAAVHTLPLCGLAVLYGYPGGVLGLVP